MKHDFILTFLSEYATVTLCCIYAWNVASTAKSANYNTKQGGSRSRLSRVGEKLIRNSGGFRRMRCGQLNDISQHIL
jgi:hypothetical protein